MNIKKNKLPKWFDGVVYEIGDEVRNPFSGETCVLTAQELSMYDFIMGAQFFIDVIGHDSNKAQNIIKEMTAGLDWFRSTNPKAYMVLLD